MTAYKLILIFYGFIFVHLSLNGQDSLSINHLNPLTFTFQVAEGELVGPGAELIKSEGSKAQFTLLGDYLDSKRIPELTNALIRTLDESGYKTIALGIGPVVAQKLQCKPAHSIVSELQSINVDHSFKDSDQLVYPIPDMKYVEDARFLQESMKAKWSLVGFGYDSWNGLNLLFEEMYYNLSKRIKSERLVQYTNAKRELINLYANRNGDILQFYNSIQQNQIITDFISMASEEEKNKMILQSYHKSLNQCYMHAQKMFFEKNKIRVQDEKRLLKEGLESLDFEITKDKLFVKWDMDFLSRGLQPYELYGVGNMLSELAEYNGSSSLNIGVMKRYYFDSNEVKDILQEDEGLNKGVGRLLQMGQKDEWVVIDIRSFVQDYNYWPQKFLINVALEDLSKRYDLIIIPRTEYSPKLNID